jgi:predicted peptidase
MRTMVKLIAVVALLFVAAGCGGGWKPTDFNKGVAPGRGFQYRTEASTGRQYAVFIPHDYDPSRSYPAVLFLHGLFEGGADTDKAVLVGMGPSVAEMSRTLPFIIIFPQARGDWRNDADLHEAHRLLQDAKRTWSIDPDRVSVTGLSVGGYGTWRIAELYPNEFSALVPMCGYDRVPGVPRIRHIPTWIFTNATDPFVSAGDSRAMYAALKQAGGDVRITEYPEFGHNCWSRGYRERELWNWLARQRRGTTVTGGIWH